MGEMRACGFTASEMRAGGWEAKKLFQAGYDTTEVRRADYPLERLRLAGYEAKALRKIEGFACRDHRRAQEHVVADLHSLAATACTCMKDILTHLL